MKKLTCLFAGSVAISILSIAQMQAHAQVQDDPASVASAEIATSATAASATAAPASRAAREAAFLAALPREFNFLGVLPSISMRNAFENIMKRQAENETTRLIGLNQGRDDTIRTLVARKLACQHEALDTDTRHHLQETTHALQEAAHALPDDSLANLMDFFSSPDYPQYLKEIRSNLPQSGQISEPRQFMQTAPGGERQIMQTIMNATPEEYKKSMDRFFLAYELAMLNTAARNFKNLNAGKNLEATELERSLNTCLDEEVAAFSRENIKDQNAYK